MLRTYWSKSLQKALPTNSANYRNAEQGLLKIGGLTGLKFLGMTADQRIIVFQVKKNISKVLRLSASHFQKSFAGLSR